ncbi:MAG: efflux RND transporter periplasmic adaptor subunit [Bacteroidetes bacterium]|jgi:cobalt-zinc-cadmium efflux system membrane fusion protein|nr:efflux RND transporter periplasmic adaptor subunit [Bacteroidota bacterium]
MKSLSFLLTATVLLFACSTKVDKENATTTDTTAASNNVTLTKAQLALAKISTGSLTATQMHKTIKVNGFVDVPPQNMLSVSIPMGGYVKKANLIPGEKVSKGSVLAVLEDASYISLQQDYLTAKSKLVFLEADYNRQKALNTSKSTSDRQFQLATTDFETQQYLVKSLSEKLQLMGIVPAQLNANNISKSISFRSPISGYVTKVNVNAGKYVAPTDVLFEIMDPSDLHARLIVFENDATAIKKGNKVTFSVNNKPLEKYKAEVHVVTPNIENERTTEVHCDIVGSNTGLIPGTFINAEIELNNITVHALPSAAIVKWQNKPFVFVENTTGTYAMVPVVVGLESKGMVELVSGVTASDKVVIANAYTLLMKLKNSGEE